MLEKFRANVLKSTGEVPQGTGSHLATTISRTLQPRDGKIRNLADRNGEFFLPSHINFLFIFGQCRDNCE